MARVYPRSEDLLADEAPLRSAVVEAVEDLGRERVDCPEGVLPVVLAAGAPAHFFHEVYGHPLEGDVVARGGTYLGGLRGRAIAEELLTVVDDPLHPGAPAGHAVDDEGETPRAVPLLDRGREPRRVDARRRPGLGRWPLGPAARCCTGRALPGSGCRRRGTPGASASASAPCRA